LCFIVGQIYALLMGNLAGVYSSESSDMVDSIGDRATGTELTIWVPITYVIGPVLTSLLVIKFSQGDRTQLDRICLVGIGIGLILWGLYRSPSIALGINIGIDFLGALPTIHTNLYIPSY
jgi:hypothetical protein